jgi:hypothetical protein
MDKIVINELLEYFYFNQYKYSYYPSYDRWNEYDFDGDSYYCYSRFN